MRTADYELLGRYDVIAKGNVQTPNVGSNPYDPVTQQEKWREWNAQNLPMYHNGLIRYQKYGMYFQSQEGRVMMIYTRCNMVLVEIKTKIKRKKLLKQ